MHLLPPTALRISPLAGVLTCSLPRATVWYLASVGGLRAQYVPYMSFFTSPLTQTLAVTFVWLILLAGTGIYNVSKFPGIFRALDISRAVACMYGTLGPFLQTN
jgi:hypothetical protein